MNTIRPLSPERSTSRHSRRGGFSLLESIVSCTLFGACCAMITPVIAQLGVVQDQLAQRDLALNELRNLVEQGLYLNEEAPLVPSASVLASLPESEFTQQVESDPAVPGTRRVQLRLTWLPHLGQPREEAVLYYWKPLPTEVSP